MPLLEATRKRSASSLCEFPCFTIVKQSVGRHPNLTRKVLQDFIVLQTESSNQVTFPRGASVDPYYYAKEDLNMTVPKKKKARFRIRRSISFHTNLQLVYVGQPCYRKGLCL
ncbi:hypothetical protein AVEN_266281-1 [Araneus ventricosus]|uniref:Uncharacterized protein n=1 Tax=Araneus ventricosus TaxID=182803 RepID=A0A4Y2RTB8_ARAVE|nr:hypothetical protein AVEN_266281-1 [Araneus ventricosus]